jgi:RNA polymerase sigma-70 factor (ECF subfamily)
MESDSALVKQVMKGQREAYSQLVKRYERAARATARAIIKDHHRAEDIAQEAFVRAFQRLAALRRPGAFGPWLMKIVRRESISWLRRPAAHASIDAVGDIPAPGGNGQLGAESEALLTAMLGLSDKHRLVVMLHYFDHRSVREIASITGHSVGTVSKQLTRARRRLRSRLKEYYP